jgi:hypothetical protein
MRMVFARWRVLLSVAAVVACAPRPDPTNAPSAASTGAADPLNAAYRIDGRSVRLVDGAAEESGAPSSAIRVRTVVFGRPASGDLDDDGDDDAVSWLRREPGGSGTFYYIVAALNEGGGFQGTEAVLLGDRIAPYSIAIRNGVVEAKFADRRHSKAMTVSPSVATTAYFALNGRGLAAVPPMATGEVLLQGWFVFGHEVRTFKPCAAENDLWVMGASPAMDDLIAAHRAATLQAVPYAPLFVTITGRLVDPPQSGFGASYAGGLSATRLVQARPRGKCPN